jgi:acetyl/propionyl-CoA carboxylase alpha subunit
VITKLLVANRGEIATRVLRTARAMGIATVAIFSDPDRDAPFVALADESVPLGGATPADSYLRADAILNAARRTGADAIHPGYGFLSERAEFAEAVLAAGLRWVGPPPKVLTALGDKLEARRVASEAGVPVLPGVAVAGSSAAAGAPGSGGSPGRTVPAGAHTPAGDPGPLATSAEQIGYPLLVKAAHGGGGIGMRVVRHPAALPEAIDAARRQAAAAFGDDTVFLERWLESPRHVEVQLLADDFGHMVHLFERECSIQRRHQKLIEESPSVAVDPDLRHRLGEAALAVAHAVGYVGAGTVEFLLADDDFWFLEVNPRIQVEHPVTEAVTGLDLIRLQLLVASGEPLPPEALHVEPRGHAIEARLYAEDPTAGFLPQTGILHRFRVGEVAATASRSGDLGVEGGSGPGVSSGDASAWGSSGSGVGGWGVRVDSGVVDGSVVGVHYDPLLAKVIAQAPTRQEAARLLASTLVGAHIHGIVTNRDLLVGILRSAAFLAGDTGTGFLDQHSPAELTAGGGSADPSTIRLHAAAAALAAQATRRAAAIYPAVPSGWRNNPSQLQQVTLTVGPGPAAVPVAYRFDRTGTLEALEIDGTPLPGPRLWTCNPNLVDLEVDGVRRRFEIHQVGDTIYIDSPLGHTEFHEHPQDAPLRDGPEAHRPGAGTHSPTPGAPPEGLWTADPPNSGDRLRSPTGGLGADTPGSRTSREPDAEPAEPMMSPLPGIVRRVAVRVGERVEAGAVVVVVEAMKTEHRIAAQRAGTVRRVLVAEGEEVAAGAAVIELEGAADG